MKQIVVNPRAVEHYHHRRAVDRREVIAMFAIFIVVIVVSLLKLGGA